MEEVPSRSVRRVAAYALIGSSVAVIMGIALATALGKSALWSTPMLLVVFGHLAWAAGKKSTRIDRTSISRYERQHCRSLNTQKRRIR